MENNYKNVKLFQSRTWDKLIALLDSIEEPSQVLQWVIEKNRYGAIA